MASVWVYSDWVTLNDSAARLTRLQLNLQEIADFLSTGDYTINGRSVTKAAAYSDLKDLRKIEEKLRKEVNSTDGSRNAFTRLRAIT